MEQFTVPQFIDVEDKIFGPITARQFSIILAAAGPIFLAYKLSDTALFIFFAILIGGSALILAFATINGQAFHYFLLNIIENIRKPSRRQWNKRYSDAELREYIASAKVPEPEEKVERRTLNNTKIRDLSLLVNTGGYYKPE